jgi:hypothetical protein
LGGVGDFTTFFLFFGELINISTFLAMWQHDSLYLDIGGYMLYLYQIDLSRLLSKMV